LPGKFFFDLVFTSHCNNAIAIDRNSSGRILRKILIHCQDKGVHEECVNLLRHSFSFDTTVAHAAVALGRRPFGRQPSKEGGGNNLYQLSAVRPKGAALSA
jgi:hypothetical protein